MNNEILEKGIKLSNKINYLKKIKEHIEEALQNNSKIKRTKIYYLLNKNKLENDILLSENMFTFGNNEFKQEKEMYNKILEKSTKDYLQETFKLIENLLNKFKTEFEKL